MRRITDYIKHLRSVEFERLSEEQKIKFLAEMLNAYIELLEEHETVANYADLLYVDNKEMRKELKRPSFEDELEMQ